jgi:hypothetical protein
MEWLIASTILLPAFFVIWLSALGEPDITFEPDAIDDKRNAGPG